MECALSLLDPIGSEGGIDIPYVPPSPPILAFPHLQGEHQLLGCLNAVVIRSFIPEA